MASPMMRGKLRGPGLTHGLIENCADCGALDPTWASVNRGILLCDECCSIHRSLGRHISQVKSLKKGLWSPTLLQMVHTLNMNGVNSIWEHFLLDPTNSKSVRRKPQAKDPLHPTKADFIRAKHQMLAFVFRPGKDDTLLQESDLSKQLHASVRTANLETSLRLLSQGADPNYFHEEKGTTPLHVAAKAGQQSQVELLFVYGADPGALDSQGKSPIDYAKSAGHRDLADRLNECVYELTDRLAYYLCSRKPDHQNGQHYIVPEMSDSLDLTELAKAAKKKLQQLPNHLFEELAMDVYDEVDRRETEAIWLSTQQPSSPLALDRCTVPFLPVNPEFSSTRNQGRQKLARFNAREFATLIIDILSDVKRRQAPTTCSLILPQDNKILKGPFVNISNSAILPNRKSEISDDEPLYDSVASDEDYITTEQIALLKQQASKTLQEPKAGSEEAVCGETNKDSSFKSNGIEKTVTTPAVNGGVLSIEQNLRRQLSISETIINDLKAEISGLQSTIRNLTIENNELRNTIQQEGLSTHNTNLGLPNGLEIEPILEIKSPRSSTQRPASMYEPREGLPHRTTGNIHHYISAAGSIAAMRDKDGLQRRDMGNDLYDSPSAVVRPITTQSLYHCSRYKPPQNCNDVGMPPAEEVSRVTDQVTKRIQELWSSVQKPDQPNTLVPYAERIQIAVTELTAIFPRSVVDEQIREDLQQLTENADRLQTECTGLQQCNSEAAQSSDRAHFLQQVRFCAYDVAKTTKKLVLRFR